MMNMVEAQKQTFGVEIEMNNITRRDAAKLAAEFFGTGRYEDTARRNGYCTWSAWMADGREWKFQKDVSIAGPDSQKCEMVTPILTYEDKAHSKDNKTRYYYFCKSIKGQTGHECSFRLNIEQNEINQMVASIVSAMVHDPRFVDAIKEKIGSAVDTSELEQQADAIKAQLRQRLSTKSRLEHQMDTLDFNDPYYDRKALDLQRRYDEQYELIEDMETQLAEIQGQIDDIHQETITADNIYHLLLAFDEV